MVFKYNIDVIKFAKNNELADANSSSIYFPYTLRNRMLYSDFSMTVVGIKGFQVQFGRKGRKSVYFGLVIH